MHLINEEATINNTEMNFTHRCVLKEENEKKRRYTASPIP